MAIAFPTINEIVDLLDVDASTTSLGKAVIDDGTGLFTTDTAPRNSRYELADSLNAEVASINVIDGSTYGIVGTDNSYNLQLVSLAGISVGAQDDIGFVTNAGRLFVLGQGGVEIANTGGLHGIYYAADYSGTQTEGDRWIPDKGYVDTSLGAYLPLAGGTMTGNIDMDQNNLNFVLEVKNTTGGLLLEAANLLELEGANLSLTSGSTCTLGTSNGHLKIDDTSASNQTGAAYLADYSGTQDAGNRWITDKGYVDGALGDYLPLAGGTMSGNINMNGNDLIDVNEITRPGNELSITADEFAVTVGTEIHLSSASSVVIGGGVITQEASTLWEVINDTTALLQVNPVTEETTIFETLNITEAFGANHGIQLSNGAGGETFRMHFANDSADSNFQINYPGAGQVELNFMSNGDVRIANDEMEVSSANSVVDIANDLAIGGNATALSFDLKPGQFTAPQDVTTIPNSTLVPIVLDTAVVGNANYALNVGDIDITEAGKYEVSFAINIENQGAGAQRGMITGRVSSNAETPIPTSPTIMYIRQNVAGNGGSNTFIVNLAASETLTLEMVSGGSIPDCNLLSAQLNITKVGPA